MKNRNRHLVNGLLVALLCLIVYLNSFHTSFHFDDFFAAGGNAAVRSLGNVGELFRLYPGRFLLMYSFAVDYHLHKLDPVGYHISNFLFHLANAILLYLIASGIFQALGRRPGGGSSPEAGHIPLFVALMFAAHPVMTEAVTYVSGRTSSLAAVFFLLSLFLYVRAFFPGEDGGAGGKRKSAQAALYAGALLAFFMSLWVKESNATLPAVLLILDFYFVEQGDWRRLRRSALRLIPFLLVLTGILVWRIVYLGAIGETRLIRSLSTNLFTQMRAIVTYLRLIFLPVGQNIDYDFPLSHSLFEPSTFLAFVFLSLLTLSAVFLFKKNKLASFGILWFLITLTPTSSIIPLWDVISERWVYLPSIGILFVAAAFLAKLCDAPFRGLSETGHARLINTPVVTVILLLSVLTISRNGVWENEYTLWKDAAEKSPRKTRPHTNLGMALAGMGDMEGALRELSTALSLDPDSPDAGLSLGSLYLQTGKHDEAVALFTTTLARFPDASNIPARLADRFAKAHFNLGLAHFYKGDYERAVAEYKSALELAPFLQWIHSNMGVAYEMMGEYEMAIGEYEKELELYPSAEQVVRNIENARRKLENRDERAGK
jgi:tetratricopeptide (TPR) repeat protein